MQHVDDKIKEAEFFYNKILENYEKEEVRHYISAFLTATRSIFYFLKTIVNENTKPVSHREWFRGEIDELKENKVWKIVTEKRDLIVHEYNEDLKYSIRWDDFETGITETLTFGKDESWKDAIVAREEEKKTIVKTPEGEHVKGEGEFILKFDGLDEYELRSACNEYLELNKQLAKNVKNRFNEKV